MKRIDIALADLPAAIANQTEDRMVCYHTNDAARSAVTAFVVRHARNVDTDDEHDLQRYVNAMLDKADGLAGSASELRSDGAFAVLELRAWETHSRHVESLHLGGNCFDYFWG